MELLTEGEWNQDRLKIKNQSKVPWFLMIV